jgi:hypothetical protein
MSRRRFIGMSVGGVVVAVGGVAYMLSNRCNLLRTGIPSVRETSPDFLKSGDAAILFHPSLAPSGHNTQRWFVNYLEPQTRRSEGVLGAVSRSYYSATGARSPDKILFIFTSTGSSRNTNPT